MALSEVGREIGQGYGGHLNEPNAVLHVIGDWVTRIIQVPSHRVIKNIGRIDVDTSELNGTSLPAHLSKMRSNQETRYMEFEKLVSRLIPSIKRVYTHDEGGGNVSIRIAHHDVSDTEQAYRLDTVGGGVNEILYLAAIIWLSPPGSIILIEEPERGLHAGSQRLLLNAALDHALKDNKQLFWATHSMIMAPLMEDCSVHLVTLPDEEGTKVINVGKEQADHVRQTLGHWNLDLYTVDVVILFDGETEEALLPEVVEQILGARPYRAIYFQPLRGDLKSKHELVRKLVPLMSASRTKIFIFADDDPGASETVKDLEREFEKDKEFTDGQVHIWDCGIRKSTDEKRGAEFEDNFSYEELERLTKPLLEQKARADDGTTYGQESLMYVCPALISNP